MGSTIPPQGSPTYQSPLAAGVVPTLNAMHVGNNAEAGGTNNSAPPTIGGGNPSVSSTTSHVRPVSGISTPAMNVLISGNPAPAFQPPPPGQVLAAKATIHTSSVQRQIAVLCYS